MSDDRDLARRVAALTAGLVALIALAGWALAGADQAAGALIGGAITIANFLWLRWTAGRALLRGLAPAGAPWRRLLWLGASGARFGVVALALGLAAAQGWLGLAGLLVSLTALPVTVMAEGLRATRAV